MREAFCANLPPRHRLDRSKCPSALKQQNYDAIKTACSCVNKACQAPSCHWSQSPCRASSGCGGYCANFKSTSNCGGCGIKVSSLVNNAPSECPSDLRQCGYGQKCIAGKCQAPSPTCYNNQELCNGSCKDKSSYEIDAKNCGKCQKEVCWLALVIGTHDLRFAVRLRPDM